MKLSRTRLFIVLAIAMSMPLTFSTSAFAAEGQCSGSGCSGVDIGGGGTGFTGTGGSGGYLSGNDFVRWDGYRADPTRLGETCTPDNRDRTIMGQLGYRSDYADTGRLYHSRRVATERNNLNNTVGGVPGSTNWELWWNADTGETRVTPPPSDPGGNGPTWFEPGWVQPGSNGEYCLPLIGGAQISGALEAAKPEVKINGKIYSDTDRPIVVTGMKGSYIEVEVPEEELQGLIAIGFDLTSLWIRVTTPDKDEPDNKFKDEFVYDNFFAIIANKKGSGVELKKVNFDLDAGKAKYRMKIRKKGTYRVEVIAGFDAQVLANGLPVFAGGVVTSTETIITARSVRSVNRRR